jgi:26S proteasome regulatory subunit N10
VCADYGSVDNSEASRNGDYVPSRWEAQQDAVNLIFSAKTGANPESSVGLMSMGGSTPEILTTLTTDIGKVLDGLHRTKIRGDSHFVTGINVAAVCIGLKTGTMQRLTGSSSPSSTGRTSRRSNG